MKKEEVEAFAQRIVEEGKQADFERWKRTGNFDLDYLPHCVIQRSITPGAPHSVRMGVCIAFARVAIRMLAMESGRAFAAFCAMDAMVPRKWRNVMIFTCSYLMVGGVLYTLDVLPPVIGRVFRALFSG